MADVVQFWARRVAEAGHRRVPETGRRCSNRLVQGMPPRQMHRLMTSVRFAIQRREHMHVYLVVISAYVKVAPLNYREMSNAQCVEVLSAISKSTSLKTKTYPAWI